MSGSASRALRGLLAAVLFLSGCGGGETHDGRDLLADDRSRLEPGESAAFHLELSRGGVLRLAVESAAAATLTVAVRELDPLSAAVARSEPALEVRLEPDHRAVRHVPLPATDREYLEVELSWPPAAAAPLEIVYLTLREPEQPRPPIIFVSVDTLAARNMSLYGYERSTTPELDELAAEGVVFDNCLANASWTTPSYISQFSGLYHRCFMDPEAKRSGKEMWEIWFLAEEHWTLTEMLRAAGYRTAGFIDNMLAGADFGLDQGFELFDAKTAEVHKMTWQPDGIRHILPRALEWLDGLEPGEPFFLYIQVLDVHCPYRPPVPFRELFRGQETGGAMIPVEKGFKAFGTIPRPVARGPHPVGELPEMMDPELLVADYDGGIAYVDDAFGELVDELRDRGILDESILIFSADHGESMLEHDYFFRHGLCYQEVLHVPLVIRLPGGEGAGTRVSTPVQLVDLYPTLAELIGVGRDRDDLHGRSLLPLMRGRALPEVPMLSEGGVFENSSLNYEGWKLVEKSPALGNPDSLSTWRPAREHLLRLLPAELGGEVPGPNEAYDLIQASPERERILHELRQAFADPVYELYDLAADPHELEDLADAEPGRLGLMKKLLERERERAESLRSSEAWTRKNGFQPDAEQLEELRNLGYAGGGSGG